MHTNWNISKLKKGTQMKIIHGKKPILDNRLGRGVKRIKSTCTGTGS
jgi:hypothetical protein